MNYIRDNNGKEQFIILDDKYFIDLTHCCVDQNPNMIKSILENDSVAKIDCRWKMLSDIYGPLSYQMSFTYETDYIVFINEWRNVGPENVSFMLFKKCYSRHVALWSTVDGYSACIPLDNLTDNYKMVFDLNEKQFKQACYDNELLRVTDIIDKNSSLYYTEGVYVQKDLLYEIGKIYMYMDDKGISSMAGFSFNSRYGSIVHLRPIPFVLKPLSLSKTLI